MILAERRVSEEKASEVNWILEAIDGTRQQIPYEYRRKGTRGRMKEGKWRENREGGKERENRCVLEYSFYFILLISLERMSFYVSLTDLELTLNTPKPRLQI